MELRMGFFVPFQFLYHELNESHFDSIIMAFFIALQGLIMHLWADKLGV